MDFIDVKILHHALTRNPNKQVIHQGPFTQKSCAHRCRTWKLFLVASLAFFFPLFNKSKQLSESAHMVIFLGIDEIILFRHVLQLSCCYYWALLLAFLLNVNWNNLYKTHGRQSSKQVSIKWYGYTLTDWQSFVGKSCNRNWWWLLLPTKSNGKLNKGSMLRDRQTLEWNSCCWKFQNFCHCLPLLLPPPSPSILSWWTLKSVCHD